MAYNDLAKLLEQMTPEQRALRVMIYSRDKQCSYFVDKEHGYAIQYCHKTSAMQPLIVIEDKIL